MNTLSNNSHRAKLQFMCQYSNLGRSCWNVVAALIVLIFCVLPAQASRTDIGPNAELMEGARRWMAQQQGAPLASLRFDALDARLRIPFCAAGWRYDHPFSSTSTVRARCQEPQAQLYLNVSQTPATVEMRVNPVVIGTPANAAFEVYRLRGSTRAGEWITSDRIETQVVPMIDAPPRALTAMAVWQVPC